MSKAMNIRSSWFAAFGVILLLSLCIWCNPIETASLVPMRTPTAPSPGTTRLAASTEEQICDLDADYSLGVGDYPETIRLHREIVRQSPRNALAHYHLGFALGMMGNRTAEVEEYQRAAALGLRTWDLFLNLGLAQVERGDLRAATDSLRRAVLLGKVHSESHFNLALVYERRGMLIDAERETQATLRLSSGQPDARNLLGVIYAEEGKTGRASTVWRGLVREAPDYKPARTNLALLGSPSEVAPGEMATGLRAIRDQSERRFPAGETQLSPRFAQ